MPIGSSDLLFPRRSENQVKRSAELGLQTGPDFTDITKAFTAMTSNPGLIARGGAWVDPMQAQQDATGGYLSARGQIAGNWLNNRSALAGVESASASDIGQISAMIPELQTSALGEQSGLFGLLGGLL